MRWITAKWPPEKRIKKGKLSYEDIESLEFIEQEYFRKVQDDYFKRMFFKSVEGTKGAVIWFNEEKGLMQIWDYTDIDECNMFDNWNMMSFRGFVKNKEELKTLLRQLTIKI